MNPAKKIFYHAVAIFGGSPSLVIGTQTPAEPDMRINR
jgi:hypothetical protein